MLALLPSASEVRLASRLRPEQVSVAFPDIAAFELDIEGRISEQAAVADRRLSQAATPYAWPLTQEQVCTSLPLFSQQQAEDWLQDQERLISLCVKYLSVGDVFDSAGQLNVRYQAEADNYMARGNRLLDQLCDEVRRVASGIDGGVVSPRAEIRESASVQTITGW